MMFGSLSHLIDQEAEQDHSQTPSLLPMGSSSSDSLIIIDYSSPRRDMLFSHQCREPRCGREHHAFVPVDHITIRDTFALTYKLSLEDLPPSD
jgi:hypothetical protein